MSGYAIAASRKGVLERHIACSVTASFRASATLAFRGPIRSAIDLAQMRRRETDEQAKEAAIKNGNVVTDLDPAVRAEWREKLSPVIESYLSEQEKELPEARQIYQAMLDAIAKYE